MIWGESEEATIAFLLPEAPPPELDEELSSAVEDTTTYKVSYHVAKWNKVRRGLTLDCIEGTIVSNEVEFEVVTVVAAAVLRCVVDDAAFSTTPLMTKTASCCGGGAWGDWDPPVDGAVETEGISAKKEPPVADTAPFKPVLSTKKDKL